MPTVIIDSGLIKTAGDVLRFHFPTETYSVPMARKLCDGCIDVWGRYVLWPCYQADWALLVRRKTSRPGG